MSLLFAMDRLQFKDRILTAQQEGKVVISNRYVMSSVVLQTARGKPKLADWIYQLEHVEMGLPKPDCYIVLTGDASVTKVVKNKQVRDYTSGEDQYESNQTLMVKTAEMYGRVSLPGSTTLTVNCIKDGWFREKNDITEDIISKLNKFIRE
jgi:dTMP kinase